MWNIREIVEILREHNLYLTSQKTDLTDLDEEENIEYLEKNVSDDEYSELTTNDFGLIWIKGVHFSIHIELESKLDEQEMKSYFNVRPSFYSMFVHDKGQYYELERYIDEAERIVEEVREKIKNIPAWKEDK